MRRASVAVQSLLVGSFTTVMTLSPRVAQASCGMGNACAVVDGVNVSANPAPAGGTVDVTCLAHDPDGVITRFAFTADTGSFGNGTQQVDVTPDAPLGMSSAAATWNVPTTPGASVTFTCVAYDNGGLIGSPTASAALSATATVGAASTGPSISSLTAESSRVFPGDQTRLMAVATDAAGGALTYAWSANGGTLAGDHDADPQNVDWTAPSAGSYVVTLTVTNTAGSVSTASIALESLWAKPSGAVGGPTPQVMSPVRIAVDAAGNFYVTDARARQVLMFAPNGGLLRTIAVDGEPSGVAVGSGGEVFVADAQRGAVGIYDALGHKQGALGRGDGEFTMPMAVAVDPVNNRVLVADGRARTVKTFQAGGALVSTLNVGGFPVGLAFDPLGNELYVADSVAGQVRVYGADGTVSRTLGGFGGAAGELTRAGGLTLASDGNVYVVDTYQGRVTAFTRSGAFVAYVGTFGRGPGQLQVPVDVVGDSHRRLVVTNSDNNRLEVFGLVGATVVACAGDSDCDGLPDAYELASGLNASDPSDAWRDADGDGLTTLQEFRLGTLPGRADSDGDGMVDGLEVRAGLNPMDPVDNLPVAVAGPDVDTQPARVTLDARASRDPNHDVLTYLWTQADGPADVEIHDATTATPWVVVRRAGDYHFRAVVNDGRASSQPVLVKVTVHNVAPQADVGPDLQGVAGMPVVLDGRFSTDANADVLTHAWTQVSGPSVALQDAQLPLASFVPSTTGLYTFQLTVADAAGPSAPARVRVVVQAANDHLPTAVAPALVTGTAGSLVRLDGGASVDTDGEALSFVWEQVQGPAATLTGADAAQASFTPAGPGVFVFGLTVHDGQHASLRRDVTVVVDGATQRTPLAQAGFDQHANVLDDVWLNGTWSQGNGVLSGQWTQVAGVPVTLVADGISAHFQPLDPGTYTFELAVSDGALAGTKDRVTVVVDDAAGNVVPVAVATVTGGTRVNEVATLHGENSRDLHASNSLGFTWVQVAGPSVVLSDIHAATPAFTPVLAGTYGFDLYADDGEVRSPPAHVDLAVGTLSNVAPVANAGADVMVVAGGTVVLDGAASVDADGQALTHTWEQVGGPQAVLTGQHARELHVSPALSGFTLRFSLTVSDGTLTSVPAHVLVHAVDTPLGLFPVNSQRAVLTVQGTGSELDGTVVTVPAGAVNTPLVMALGAVSRPWFQASGRAAQGQALYVGPVGMALGQPLTVRLPLDSQARTQDMQVEFFDHDAATWQRVVSTVDEATRSITVTLSKPGVLQVTTPASEPSTASPTRSSCGCRSTGDGAEGGLFLVVLAMVLRFRRRAAAVLLALPLFMLAGQDALATDAPHDATTLPNGCADCHTLHASVGMALTKAAGNANLCISCHTSGQLASTLPFAAGDQAVPGVSGNSHRWDSSATNATYAAVPPGNAALRLSTGLLMCSTCHDQHSQADAPFDPTAPAGAGSAGRHFMRIPNGSGQLCLECHAAWNVNNAHVYTGNPLSHPVGVTFPSADPRFYTGPRDSNLALQVASNTGAASAAGTTTTLVDTAKTWVASSLVGQSVRFTTGANKNLVRAITANTATQITFAAVTAATALGDKYEIDQDGNLTNNLLLDNAGTPSFTAGNVVCMTCHGVHYADSNTATYDGPPGTPCTGADCGKLLRRSNNGDACIGCHKVLVHNSSNTSTTYGTWGGTFTCGTCHDPHGSKNIYLIRESITTPNSGAKAVDFRNTTGKADNSFATATTPGNGVCEVCHTQTKNGDATPRFRNTGGSDGNKHYSGTCTTCHTHAGAFKGGGESGGNAACSSCHDFDMVIGDLQVNNKYHHVMEVDDNIVATLSTYPTAAVPTVATADKDKTCLMCHADHNVFRTDLNASNTLGRGANLRTRIANGPPTGAPPAASAPGDVAPGYYGNKDFDNTYTSGGICLSCHTNAQTKNVANQKADGTTVTPALAKATFNGSAHAYLVNGRITNGASTFTEACVKCHNDDAIKSYQDGTWKFTTHSSVDRSLRSPLGITTPADPMEEEFCLRCHHKVGDTTPGGGPAKTVANNDYYGAVTTMTAGSQDIFTAMNKGTPGQAAGPTTLTNTLNFKPLAEQAVTGNAPTGHNTADTLVAASTWTGRAMTPTASTGTNDAVTVSIATNAAAIYHRAVTFTSPAVATATTTAAGNWTINIYARESATTANAKVRYAVYVWTAANAKGADIVTRATFATEMGTTALPGASQAVTAAGLAVPLAVGDKIVVDLEIEATIPTAATTASYSFGTTAPSNVVMPSNVAFTFATTGSPSSGRHDVAAYHGVHRANSTDETQAYISANKHVECTDCHDAHASGATKHVQGTNLVSAALADVPGSVATFSGTNWTAPTAYAFGTATKEYEICFKCHSAANTSLATWDSTWTNVGLEFSPANASYHPVVGALPATDPGANGSSRLVAAQLTGGWTPGQTMYCSDCHGNDSAAPAAQGPHGSAAQYILKGPNTLWPNAQLTAFATTFCANCHVAGQNNVHTRSNHTSSRCYNCHVTVPHGGKVSRLIGDRQTMPARYAYQANLNNQYMSSFTKRAATAYVEGDCGSAQSGCTNHTGGTENW